MGDGDIGNSTISDSATSGTATAMAETETMSAAILAQANVVAEMRAIRIWWRRSRTGASETDGAAGAGAQRKTK